MEFVPKTAKNVGKAENAVHQHFLLYQHHFQMSLLQCHLTPDLFEKGSNNADTNPKQTNLQN